MLRVGSIAKETRWVRSRVGCRNQSGSHLTNCSQFFVDNAMHIGQLIGPHLPLYVANLPNSILQTKIHLFSGVFSRTTWSRTGFKGLTRCLLLRWRSCSWGIKEGMAHSKCGKMSKWQVKQCDPSLIPVIHVHYRVQESLMIKCYMHQTCDQNTVFEFGMDYKKYLWRMRCGLMLPLLQQLVFNVMNIWQILLVSSFLQWQADWKFNTALNKN